MTNDLPFYGAYFTNGVLEGSWYEMDGNVLATIPYIAINPETEKAYTVKYVLTYETTPSPDGRRNFFYQYQGE